MNRSLAGPALIRDLPGIGLSAGLCSGAIVGLGEAFFVLASTTPSEYQALGFGPSAYSVLGAVFGLAGCVPMLAVQARFRLRASTLWNLLLCVVVFGLGGGVAAAHLEPHERVRWASTWLGGGVAATLFWMWFGGNLLTKTPLQVLPTRRGTLAAWGGSVGMCWMFALTPPPGIAEEPAPPVMQGPEFAERPNLLILQIDGLSTSDLAAYGGQGTARTIDGFSRTALVFDQAISAAPDAGGATASLFTSALAPDGPTLPPARRSLAQHLQEVGYVTGGLPNDPATSGVLGFGRGFYWYPFYAEYPLGVAESSARLILFPAIQQLWESVLGHPARHRPRSAQAQLDRASSFIRANGNRRWFLWVQLGDLLALPAAGDPAMGGAEAARLRALADLDAPLGTLLSALGAEGLTIVVITSGFGGQTDTGLSDQNLRVPLILRRPGEPLAGEVVPYQVRLVDLAPTLADTALLPPAPGWVGQTLLPDGLVERLHPPPDEELPPTPQEWWNNPHSLDALATAKDPERVMLRRGGLKVVRQRTGSAFSWELYDLVADPHELVDARAHPQRIEMEARLEESLPSWTGR